MPQKSDSTPKKVSSSNTKNEILKAYDELLDQLKEAKSQDPQKEMETKRREEILKEVSGQSDEKIIQQIASLKVSLNGSLDSIEDQLNTSFKKLNKTQEAIKIQEDRLKELYQINAEADSLAALIASQKEKKTGFENYMAEEKARWEKEQKEREEQRKEEEEMLKKQRKREEEEYNYKIQQKRKIESDQYEEKKNKQEKELKEKKEAFEQEIKSREQAVAQSENELQELRKQVEEFPANLKKEVDNATKLTTETLKREYDYEKLLKAKEYESELKLHTQTITNLQNRIKDLELQLKQAYSKIDSAENNVKDITIKAIESSASSRNNELRKAYQEPTRSKEQE